MDFNPDTWGTVADWVGGLGTTAAFVAAVVVIAKDAKVRRMAQVRKVVFTVEKLDLMPITIKGYGPEPVKDHRYTLTNLSDEPIYHVALLRGRKGAYAGEKEVLLPGEELFVDQESGDKELVAAFQDNSDRYWVRYVHGNIDTLKIGRRWF